jgi:hypothetical protein
MDFLITRGLDLANFIGSLRLAQTEGEGRSKGHFAAIGAFNFYSTELLPSQNGKEFYLFDGQCAAGGEFFHPFLNDGKEQQLTSLIDKVLVNGLGSIHGGVFCLGKLNQQELLLTPDHLNQYSLYWSKCSNGWMVSNNYPLIVKAMTAFGQAPRRSLRPCIENMIFGGVVGTKTHVEQIQTFPYGTRLRGCENLDFLPLADDTTGFGYDDAISNAFESIRAHTHAVSNSVTGSRAIIADITGGSDSRCVLSFLLNSGLSGEIAGRCITAQPNPDAAVAARIKDPYRIPNAAVPHVTNVPSPIYYEQ